MPWLALALTWFESIPGTFWGVIAGSFFSLTGVALTNRAADKRLRTQLANDRELRAKERELALRKDIYLAAAEAFQAGLLALQGIWNLDLSNEQLSAIATEKAAALAKVYIIGSQRSLDAVAFAEGQLNKAFLEGTAKRIPLLALKSRISLLDVQFDRFSNSSEQLIEMMKQFNIEGSTDQNRFEIINSNIEFEQKRSNEILETRKALQKELNEKLLVFGRESMLAAREVNTALVDVMTAARADLEIATDPDLFVQMWRKGIVATDEDLGKFYSGIQREIDAIYDRD
jgi:hypothetical protein